MTDNDENQGNTRRDDTSSDVQSDWRQDQDPTTEDEGTSGSEEPQTGQRHGEDTGQGL